jgi:Phosphoenolpyruvate phosphomutase
VTIDLESGYGGTSKGVGETIGLAIDAGGVGCNIEDSFPANGTLREMPGPMSFSNDRPNSTTMGWPLRRSRDRAPR